MLLQELFTSARMKIPLESEDKAEVFEELVDLMVRSYDLSCRDAILAAIEEREAKMSTGIKTGIAVPHGRTDALSRMIGAVGVSRQGIDYDALDGQPVKLVFMLVGSGKDSELHLTMLRKLARLIEFPRFCEEMLAADGPEKAYSLLRSFEDMALAGDA